MNRRKFLAAITAGATWSCAGASRGPLQGPTSRSLQKYLRTNWSQDPFSYGSYSYVSKDSPGAGESDRATLEAPIDDRIFFAGEALNPNYQSSVHAAHESGLRVAEWVGRAERGRVAIIGAGMSGLTAASSLEGRAEVTVFEGRDRMGGRLWTDRSLGAAVDLGATWIHGPRGNPLTALADEAGIPRVATRDDYVVRGRDGRKMRYREVPEWFDDVVGQTTTGVEPDRMNETYLETVFPVYGLGYPGGDVKFPNGYDEILAPLSGAYDVRLSSVVERVAVVEGGVDITVTGEEPQRFDAVIVTVPLGVLKRGSITFEPALSSEKQGAISRMGMGTLDKLYLLFDHVFWDAESTVIFTPETDFPPGHFNYWVNFYPYLEEPILLGFNAASPARALSGLPDDELVSRAVRTLDLAYPS